MLRIASKADTRERFVEIFAPFCDRDSFFIVTRKPKDQGTNTRFAIHLADGEPIISGKGTVIATYRDRDNRFQLPGMQLQFTELYGQSKDMVDRLIAARESAHKTGAKVGPDRRAGTSEVLAPPAPASVAPRQEERAKGSDFILPANPFGELTDSVLEAFVECAMYEDANAGASSGNADVSPEHDAYEPVDLPSWWSDRASLGPTSTGPLPQLAVQSIRAQSPRLATAPGFPFPASATPPFGTPLGVPVTGRPITVNPLYGGGAQIEPATSVGSAAQPSSKLVLTAAVAAAGVAAVISLLLGYIVWGTGDDKHSRTVAATPTADETMAVRAPQQDSAAQTAKATLAPAEPESEPAAPESAAPAPAEPESAAPAPAEPESAAPAPAEPEPAEPESAEAPPESPAADATARAAAAGSPGDGMCQLTVESEPAQAQVFVGSRLLGETPHTASLECGPVQITLKRARRETATRDVVLEPGETHQVSVRLARPQSKLTVASKPPGAKVTIDGKSVGETPVSVTVFAFRSAEVAVTKDGYVAYHTKVKPSGQTARVDARLQPIKKIKKKARKRR